MAIGRLEERKMSATAASLGCSERLFFIQLVYRLCLALSNFFEGRSIFWCPPHTCDWREPVCYRGVAHSALTEKEPKSGRE